MNEYSSEIKKFSKALKLIKWAMPGFGPLPTQVMLRLFFFSPGFGDQMVIPLIALFLGTGKQTANVSCAILEHLFDDPNMKLWDYDPNTLLPNLPQMVTFPKLHNFYEDWRKDLIAKGIDIRLDTEVAGLMREKDGVVVCTKPYSSEASVRNISVDVYDEVVLAILADDVLKLLGKDALFKERFVPGGAKFLDDVTITHSDSEYFQRHYETKFDRSRKGASCFCQE